jgi:hypothetical protein
MKILIATVLLASSLISVAHASEKVCGQLKSVNSSPKCEAGQMCSHMIRVTEILTQTSGIQIELQTRAPGVLKQMSALNGSTVCVSGNHINDGQFEVASIRKAVSAF